MRLDQWLWAVRVFPSRTIAANAVKHGDVLVDGVSSKPAHEIRAGEVVTIRRWREERMLEVLGAPQSRVGAKLAPAFARETLAPPMC